MPGKSQHLQRRSGGVFYWRCRLPADLVDIAGRAEFRFSLHTCDRRRAQSIVRCIDARVAILWDQLRARGTEMTRDDVDRWVREYFREILDNFESDHNDPFTAHEVSAAV